MHDTSSTCSVEAAASGPARVRLYQGVSCITFNSSNGPWSAAQTNYFDIPKTDYSQGTINGAMAAIEVLAECERDMDVTILTSVLEKAFALRDSEPRDNSLRGAAVGVIGVLEDFLRQALEHGFDAAAFATQHFAGYEQCWKDDLAYRCASNKKFIAGLKRASKVTA